jgi:signal transduction histidine kinase
MDTKKYNLLYVDDELHNLTSFKAAFRRHYNIQTANSAKEGMEIMKETPIHLIITDQRMPEMTGVEFLEQTIGLYPESIRMILTGFSDVDDIIRAINTGRIYRYITKPWQEQELKLTIDLALESLDLKLTNAELQKEIIANELSIQASKFKDQFLANMSHEIRTPMNAIVGMTRLLLKRDQDPENSKYLNAIRQAGNNLLVIINDILDISKIEAGKLDLELIPFNLREMITNVINTIQFRATEKQLNLLVEVSPEIPESIFGDPTRITQVLINLLGNAVKFTEKGSVILKARLIADSDQDKKIQFEIIDTGIGIPEEKLPKIFESFSQAEQDTSRKFGGTGLGLAISRQLTEMMGGIVSVKSTFGAGTIFIVQLPCQETTKEEVKKAETNATDYLQLAAALRGIKILLAEDDSFNQIVAVDTLTELVPDVMIDIAVNGRHTVEKALTNDYDLILMDLQMPEMNGQQAAVAILETKPQAKIMAMTADAFKTDVDKCYGAGMLDYISKPFDEADLITKIHRLVNLSQ